MARQPHCLEDFHEAHNYSRTSPPIPVVILCGAWVLFVVFAFSDAGMDFLSLLAFVFGGLLWAIVWLGRLVTSLIRQRRRSIPSQSFRTALLYWGFEPTVLLLSAVLAFSGVLGRIRFHLSHHALDSYVADVTTGRVHPQELDDPRRWVGLVRVRETELLPSGGVRIITAEDGLDDAGFALSTASKPPIVGEDSYTYLTAGWYLWHRSW
jgi:hypothetical protein